MCDALRLHSGPLSSIRQATPPTRNNLSHANKVRPAEMAKKLFWAVLEHLGHLSPRFVSGKSGKRFVRKFKRTIHLVDSTTIFDRAYVDFEHLVDLSMREVFWVTRAKENLNYRVARSVQAGTFGKILRDDLIELQTPVSRAAYPVEPRRIVALVVVDGREVEMVFLTNNMEWSAASIGELYRCRWQIEVFFKQIKQTLQLADFLGATANAVRWRVWTALLVYLLLRYLAFLSEWSHSFSRLFTLLRAALWKKWDVLGLLRFYGTAGGHFRYLAQPEQAYLPGWG